MNLPDFDYLNPITRQEVVDLLSELGADANIFAGGTDLIPNMKNGTIKPKTLISLKNLSPSPARVRDDGTLQIDGLMTLTDINESVLIRDLTPSLAKAALQIAGQQIRNRATLAGNICQEIRCLYLNQSHSFQFVDPCYKRAGNCCYPYPAAGKSCLSVYMSDIAPVLMTLNASLEILSSQGTRTVKINDFYSGHGLEPLNLQPNEMIISILVPQEFRRLKCDFVKATPRGGLEFAMISVAIALDINKQSGRRGKARIAVGSITPRPERARQAEKELLLEELSETFIAKIAKTVAYEVKPLPHHGYSKGYLRQLIEVHTKRCLISLIDLQGQPTATQSTVKGV